MAYRLVSEAARKQGQLSTDMPSLTVGLLTRQASTQPSPRGRGRQLLVPRQLLNNPTKLAKAKFFIRTQQRSLCVYHPIVSMPERVQFISAAPKNFPQQSSRAISVD